MAASLEKWQSVTQDPRVVTFFDGLFEHLGVRVTDTGEAFTCHHRGNRIDFEAALDASRIDYTVEIQSFQVDRLAGSASKGELDEGEQYRIVSALFTPATAAALQKAPILSSGVLRRLAGSKELIHVGLKPPSAEEAAANHTLICVARQWLVIPGLHGRPQRSSQLTTEEALTFQRRLFAAMKANTWRDWLKFSLWYRQWRQQVRGPG